MNDLKKYVIRFESKLLSIVLFSQLKDEEIIISNCIMSH
jgi:hypothetical protein